MAKAVKPLLTVVGAAVGFVTLGPAGIFVGAYIGNSLGNSAKAILAPKVKAPAVSPSSDDRLTANIDLRTPRKIVVGSTAMATDIRDQEWSADQSYLDRFIVVASHRVQAIREIWFDDKLAWSAAGGIGAAFAGYLWVTPVLEGSAANTIVTSGRMGASRRFTGCAYVHLRYKLTGNGKKAESPFATTIPSRMTIVGDGMAVYDPRLDSSVGGSGPQRADDQSTWAWSESAGRNPALQLLTYLLGWRIGGKLAVGKGLPAARIDVASFMTAANLCDEPVARSAGGTEPRYRADGIFSEGDDLRLVLDNFKAAMNAELDDADGRIRLSILYNDLASPRAALGAGDVLGDFTWDQTEALSDTVNIMRGGYTDASAASLYQMVDYPEVRIAAPDGIDRVETVNLPLVQSASQAQRLVKLKLQRALYAGTFTAVFQATAWRYQKGDIVPFTFPPLGFGSKLFRIAEMTIQVDGTVPMTLREEHPSMYAWDASDAAPVQGAAPTTYLPDLWPIVQGIVDAGTTAEWPNVADTDGTKPDPNATNSADPNSPFGPDGTVGGTINRLSDFDRAVAAAKARQDTLDNETIPAIDAAVLDAGERITAARDRADAAYGQADKAIADADKVNRRVDAIVAEGGYDDRDVRAEIKRVDETAISRDVAVGRRVDTVQASFTAAKGLTPNADFAAGGEGWAAPGFSFPSYIGGRVASSAPGVYSSLIAAARTKVADPARGFRLHCTFRVFGAAQVLYCGLQMHNGAGEHIGNVYSDNIVGGPYAPGSYTVDQLYVGTFPEPALPQFRAGGRFIPTTNSVAPLFLANYPDAGGPFAGGYVQVESFWIEEVGTAQLADAKATQAATAAAGAAQSVADLSTSVTARFRGVSDTFANYDQQITTLTTGQDSFARRATALESSASASSTSIVFNDNFAVWSDGLAHPNRWALWEGNGNYRTQRLSPGRGGGQYCVRTQNDHVDVNSGFVQRVYTAGAGKWVIEVIADFDGSGARGAGVTLDGVWNLDFCAEPDNGGFVGDRANVVRSWSKMVDLDGRDQISVHAMHGWTGFGRGVAAKYMVWHCLRLRPATDGEIKAGKADAALNAPGGVIARTKANEDTLADLPNRYAAASRTAALEAQVNFAADSGLQRTVNARIEDRATAIADAKTGAVAETVRTLRGEYDGTKAAVTQQAGLIAGHDGKLAAYVRLTTTAGDGRAYFSLWTDSNGGRWALGGDGLVDGNLTVTGTITTRALAVGAASDMYSLQRFYTELGTEWPQSSAYEGVSATIASPTGQPIRVDVFAAEASTNYARGSFKLIRRDRGGQADLTDWFYGGVSRFFIDRVVEPGYPVTYVLLIANDDDGSNGPFRIAEQSMCLFEVKR